MKSKYTFIKKINEGMRNKVYLAYDENKKKKVIIKITKQNNTIYIQNEIDILLRLGGHPYIVKILDVIYLGYNIGIVLEYVKGIDLFDFINNVNLNIKSALLKKSIYSKIFLKILLALEFCHINNVAHRDLKPENIMIDDDFNIKLIDFELSYVFKKNKLCNDSVGSILYAAPEIIKQKNYVGPEVDVWALGILLCELFAGYHPFLNIGNSEILNLQEEKELTVEILNMQYYLPEQLDYNIEYLIENILVNKKNRMTLQDIKNYYVKNPFDGFFEI